jgi:predicted RNase H-like nuclease (RuvC/YqgF family)
MIFGTVTKATNDVPNETIQQDLLSIRGVLDNIVSKLEKSEIRNDLLTQRLEMTEQTNMDLKERLAAAENRIRILGNCNQGGILIALF